MLSDFMPESTIPQAIGANETPILELYAPETEIPSTHSELLSFHETQTLLPPIRGEEDASVPTLEPPSVSGDTSISEVNYVTVTEPIPVQIITAGEKKAVAAQKGPSRWQKAISLSFVALLLAQLFIPVAILAGLGLSAYTTYKHVHDQAYSGYHHFLNLKPLVSTIKAHPTTAITPSNLAQAEKELVAARSNFTQVQNLLHYTPVIQTIEQYFPQYRTQISTVENGSRIGVDIADIGLQLTNLGLLFGPRLHGSLLSTATTPLLTRHDLDQIHLTLDTLKPLLNDIQMQSSDLNLDALPLTQSQRLQVASYLSLLPQVQSALTQSDSLLAAAAWLLGVDGPRTLLVQPMDRGELRATGGFTGQYGELTINQGRVEPFSMRNIALLEYNDNSYNVGRSAPQPYLSWWPFANWGLRDSNLSADFPTSAKIAIDLYKKEAGRSVDGVVMLTPFAIEDVLKITGPLYIAEYNETITAQNLEDRLHYYQLGPGIAKQKAVTHLTNDDAARKQFTSELAHVLMDTVRHDPPQTLIQIGKQLLHDLKTRDLQIYLQNPQIEDLLVQYGYAGLLDRSTQHDGLYIVQSNVSASKASQYVRTIVTDNVQLDQQGGITHSLKMQLLYDQTGPVYGLDTYRDYVRFYLPPGAVLRAGDGFDSGQPLCGGPLGPCAADNVYPQKELVCPSGQYDAGYAAAMLNDPYVEQDHPLDTVGKPDNLQSDEPGRAMFGGYVVIPKNCAATLTLSWYVPPLAAMTSGYQLLIQRQAGTYPEYHLSVTPPAAEPCSQTPLSLDQVLQEDLLISLKSSAVNRTCTLSQLS